MEALPKPEAVRKADTKVNSYDSFDPTVWKRTMKVTWIHGCWELGEKCVENKWGNNGHILYHYDSLSKCAEIYMQNASILLNINVISIKLTLMSVRGKY